MSRSSNQKRKRKARLPTGVPCESGQRAFLRRWREDSGLISTFFLQPGQRVEPLDGGGYFISAAPAVSARLGHSMVITGVH